MNSKKNALSVLAAAVLAAFAAAPRAQAAACAADADRDNLSLALWLTDSTNPDAVPCAARLAQSACDAAGGVETRTFLGADGGYKVVYAIADSGAVTVSLTLANEAGVGSGSAVLATYPYRRAIYRGVGVDNLQVFDTADQQTKSVGNAMIIPAAALTENGKKMCPAS